LVGTINEGTINGLGGHDKIDSKNGKDQVNGNRGNDVWDYGSPDRPLLQKALDFLLPYITKTERWPYSQVTPISRHIIAADLLCHAAVQYPRNSSLYAQIYRSLVDDRPFFDSHNLPCMNR